MKFLKIILVAAVGILITSCCSCRKNTGKASAPLVGTQWTLIQLDGKLVQANGNYFLTLNEEEGRINGRGDCNSFAGSYTLPASGGIQMSGIVSTRAFCPNQQQEDRFLKVLGAIDRYEVDGKLLMLYTNNELTAVLEAK